MTPRYFLQLEYRDVCLNTRVNDCPIHVQTEHVSTEVKIPLNHWLFCGGNLLKIHIPDSPRSQDSHCDWSIQCLDHSGVIEMASGNLNNTNMATAQPLTVEFQVTTAFPLWAWLKGEVLSEDSKTLNAMRDCFTELYSAYATANDDLIVSYRTQQISELAVSNYASTKSVDDSFREKLHFIRAQSGLKLMPLNLDSAQLKLFADGRLATLVDEDGDSPILFLDVESGWCAEIPALYMKSSDGHWVLIR